MQRPARPGYGDHERGDTHDGSRLGRRAATDAEMGQAGNGHG